MLMATRRDLLAAGAASALARVRIVDKAAAQQAQIPRVRSRLDDGWRFHFGHAQDPARDFGFEYA